MGGAARRACAVASLALVAGCARGDVASRLRDAAAATDYATARAACFALPTDLQPECLVGAYDRLGGLDRADCDALPDGLWHEECVFLYAERLAAAGKVADAIPVCGSTRFGRECSFHLVRAAVERVLDQPIGSASAAIEPYRAMPLAPDAPRLFWRTWFRDRLAANTPIDPAGCPDADCLDGAREALYFSLSSVAHTSGEAFCAGPLMEGHVADRVLWADTDVTRAWVAEWTNSECARRVGASFPQPER